MIIFISCVKNKMDCPCVARDMYISDLFKKSLSYAKQSHESATVYILSAKYGLLELDEQIEPYELTLNTMNKGQRKEWANKVLTQCKEKGISFDEETIFLCGKKYREFLMDEFKNSSAPLKHMGIGEQLAFYKKETYKR
jgi:cytoplasmic iron level regulating protein YaaA (DUF328/UPF0246 family)